MPLIARAFRNFSANKVSCGLSTRGEICADSTGNGAVGGGFWPKGTVDEYVFNSGLQVAGIIQGAKSATNPWGGDTTGGFFFDPKGSQRHGTEVTKIYSAVDPVDIANWPDISRVPLGDSAATLFDPQLRGRISASDGDMHFITWEGDPRFLSGRAHPLGILADFRVMGWNYPNGNDDVMYVLITLYNISSTSPSAYSQHRPAMQALLLQKAAEFQSANNAAFGITLPAGGYTVGPMYAGITADMDVGTGTNFNSANLPFAMGYTYQSNFFTAAGWTFDPAKFGAPFLAGTGFVGTKFLNSSTGAPAIQLWSGHSGGGSFPDPNGVVQLFRYLSARLVSGLDVACADGFSPAVDHVCWVRHSTGADVRNTQSSIAFTLAPGQSTSFAVAYIFAAPVALPGFTPASNAPVDPGNVTWTNHPDSMLAHPGVGGLPGVGRVDSITGFLGYIGQTVHNANGSEYQPTIRDFKTVPRSLLGKAQLAQAIFDNHFLLPTAPQAPDFFLIPGDKQVTILWKPSATDAATPGSTGDGYFTIANPPSLNGAPNQLYDPNYRRFDVEGYRIYRSRLDAAASLRLLVQFDYAGTVLQDFGGNVVAGSCAPEVGSSTECPVTFTAITPGIASTTHRDYDLNGNVIQVRYGDRNLLANGKLLTFHADTLISGGGSGYPALSNNGVPFVFTDRVGAPGCATCGVSNGVKYFYSVTAFDVNSLTSGPSSLESPRLLKSVNVQAAAGNFDNSATVQSGIFGRNGLRTDNVVPTLDATGKFSKAFPPTNGVTLSLATFAAEVLKGSGSVSMQFDSTVINAVTAGTSADITEWFTLATPGGSSALSVNFPSYSATSGTVTAGGAFAAIPVDGVLAATYGGSAGYAISGAYGLTIPGAYFTSIWGRGCANNLLGGGTAARTGQCYYFGPRWFVGNNETTDNPNVASPVTQVTSITTPASFNNAGTLPGVVTLHHPDAYGYITGSNWRDQELVMAPFASAADYLLYWGAAGRIDSVIDLTHDTAVPFRDRIGSSWGVLNPSAASAAGSFDGRPELTATDFTCVPPLRTFSASNLGCSATYLLGNTVVPGPVAFFGGGTANARTVAAAPNNGFGLYLKGRLFVLELAGGAVPASGTAWTMRDYSGGIYGGTGAQGGNLGSYQFFPAVRPFTAPGSAIRFAFAVHNEVVATTSDILARVHTVPDPYYVTNAYERSDSAKVIKFVHLPVGATIRIYTASARLVRVLRNSSDALGGTVDWDVRSSSGSIVASGVYFYTVEADGVSRTFRMTIVSYAPRRRD